MIITVMSAPELDKALRETYDLFVDRCLVANFLVLGDTAKGIMEGELKGDKIEVGIEEKYLTESVRNTLKLMEVNKNAKNDDYFFKIGKTPVEIKVIKEKYPFFEHPDFKFYMGDTFYHANPFNEYWEQKDTIK